MLRNEFLRVTVVEKKFARLGLWASKPEDGAMHMAIDEALLHSGRDPILRCYRWRRAEITFGYPMRWREMESRAAGRPAVRRWTGGGMVEHGEDLTVALAIPAGNSAATEAPLALYEQVHRAISEALDSPSLRLAGAGDCSCGDACFANPAPFDVLRDGIKITGGALRRSREGMLYQGSIQSVKIPSNFVPRLASNLAENWEPWAPPTRIMDLAENLRSSRYATPAWLEKR